MKRLFTFLLTVIAGASVHAAAIPGTVVLNKITLGDDSITNKSIGDTVEMKGTPKQVANTTARDAIPAARRTEGMTVWVVADGKDYRLVGGILNADWQEVVATPDGLAGSNFVQTVDSRALSFSSNVTVGGVVDLRTASGLSAVKQLNTNTVISLTLSNTQIGGSFAGNMTWTLVTNTPAFLSLDGVGGLFFKDRLWRLGGWSTALTPDTTNSVLSSSNGVSWTYITNAPWEGRHTFGHVVFDGKMWVIGGDIILGHYQNDIWSSTDGTNWVEAASSVPWSNRVFQVVQVFNGNIWLMGGQKLLGESSTLYNDVWVSSNGTNWSLVTSNAPWTARGMIIGHAIHAGKMWLIGGGTYDTPGVPRTYYNDVWSTPDGTNWTQVLAQAPWSARQYHNVAVWNNRLWVVRGWDGQNTRDVWSSADGVSWLQYYSPLEATHAATLIVNTNDNSLYSFGGVVTDNSVWKLSLDTNGTLVPGLVVTSDGKVGIGITAPTNTLAISGLRPVVQVDNSSGNSAVDTTLRLNVPGQYGHRLDLMLEHAFAFARFDNYYPGGVTYGDFRFRRNTGTAVAPVLTSILTLAGNGKVGIGTNADPTSILHIVDTNPVVIIESANAAISKLRLIYPLSGGNSGELTYDHNNVVASLDNFYPGDATYGGILFRRNVGSQGSPSLSNTLALVGNGNAIFDRNVGIGVTPTTNLNIRAAAPMIDLLGTGGNFTSRVRLGYNVLGSAGEIMWNGGTASLTLDNYYPGTATVGGMSFRRNTGSQGSPVLAETLTLLGNGKVGISTNNPQATLHVVGTQIVGPFSWPSASIAQNEAVPLAVLNSGTDGGMLLYNANPVVAADNNIGIYLGTRATTGTNDMAYIHVFAGKENSTNGDYRSYFQIRTTDIGGGEVNAMRVTSAGNVGIGTTSPAAKLDVAGDIRASTTITATNGFLSTNHIAFKVPTNAPTDGQVVTASGTSGATKWAAVDGGSGGTNRYYEAGEAFHWVEVGGTNGDPYGIKGSVNSATVADWAITYGGNVESIANFIADGSVTLNGVFGGGLSIPFASAAVMGSVSGLTAGQSIRVDAAGTGFEAFNTLTNTAQFDTDNADIVLGTAYTNSARRLQIFASFQLNAAAAGTAKVTVYSILGTTTNKLTISAGPLASLTTTEPLTMRVQPGGYYYYADETSGTGATAAFVAGTHSRFWE